MRILEEFWYGNIEPTEYDTSSCKEYKKLLELICRIGKESSKSGAQNQGLVSNLQAPDFVLSL